ncbi:hypothetical protein [Sphingomonas melonis]|uniref:hypothetical protein n=1 Tax=Sphingomonas melonis TaxID=152682 RepID=UPI000A74A02F|nr:hypothetical protein [Sphingomonas melonis]
METFGADHALNRHDAQIEGFPHPDRISRRLCRSAEPKGGVAGLGHGYRSVRPRCRGAGDGRRADGRALGAPGRRHPQDPRHRGRPSGRLAGHTQAQAGGRDGCAPAKPRRTKPKPRPSRSKLDQAEQAIDEAEQRYDAARRDLAAREAALRKERQALDNDRNRERERLETARADQERHYREAMAAWREGEAD